MSQRDALRALDVEIRGALADAGLLDAAGYLPPGAPTHAVPTPCDVLVDRAVRLYGDDDADVATPYVVVTLFTAQVSPSIGGVVRLTGESLQLRSLLDQDESKSRWVVYPDTDAAALRWSPAMETATQVSA